MTTFALEILTDDLPDRAYLRVDDRFDIAVLRTPHGIEFRVFPVTNGETWMEPYEVFFVDEARIIELEHQFKE